MAVFRVMVPPDQNMNIAYPIANDAHDALARMKAGTAGVAAREKEAETLSGARVAFVTQSIGPLYETQDEALKVYGGLIGEVCQLTARIKAPAGRKTKGMAPEFKDGERWPKRPAPIATVWQLSVSYWKIISDTRAATTSEKLTDQARHLRKTAKGQTLTPEELLALTQSPLVAAKPQKALDFGLFDFIPPDNPGIVIADE